MATLSPTNPPSNSGFFGKCFAAGETLQLESGSFINIEDARVGNRVLAVSSTGQQLFAPIVAIPHAKNDIKTSFTRLATAQGKSISMVDDHLVFAGTCGRKLTLLPAMSVKRGDCLRTIDGDEAVVGVEKHVSRGIYTVVTTEEFLMVSGIMASPFAVTHTPCHLFYHLHRALYCLVPSLLESEVFQKGFEAFGLMVTSPFLRF